MYRARTLLIVEDAQEDVYLLKRALDESGLNPRLHAVADGEEAMEYLRGEGRYADRAQYRMPDLVLLDLRMPRMDGFDVLSWVRQQPKLDCLIVVVLSASNEPGDVERAYRLRANSYLTKRHLLAGGTHEMVGLLHRYWLNVNTCPPAN